MESGASTTSTMPGVRADAGSGTEEQHPHPGAARTLGDGGRPLVGAVRVDRDHGLRIVGVVRAPHDDLTPGVGTAVGADAVREPRLVAARAVAQVRRFDLVLRPALVGPRVGLSLLGDGHGARQSSAGPAEGLDQVVRPARCAPTRLLEVKLAEGGPARIGLALVGVAGSGRVQVLAAHDAEAQAVLGADDLGGEGEREGVPDPGRHVELVAPRGTGS